MLIKRNLNGSFLDSILEDSFGDFFNLTPNFSGKGFSINISESDYEFLIEADMPGVKKEDIHIETEGDFLTLSAKREELKEDKNSNLIYKESYFGSFSRKIRLKNIDTNKINAEFKEGILYVKLGKQQSNSKKNIDVL